MSNRITTSRAERTAARAIRKLASLNGCVLGGAMALMIGCGIIGVSWFVFDVVRFILGHR